MTTQARGAFDIKSTPHPATDMAEGLNVGRITFHKKFRGDLEGASVLEMLGVMDKALGSGGYVALERITGVLAGRSGSFVMQHSSLMARGKPTQSITVVPDSGTGELTGLAGSMTIDIVNGSHFYVFDYTLNSGT
ncbi:DUF3224 domain-containing protein [Archangium sp.]|uniref:DUF3224 domain-containing protein n=1 Tax=Archangium sp. TaxID=1872627 RepID=UPI003899A6BE